MATPPSSRPPRASRPPGAKRPWYLIVALIGSWLFGAAILVNGCETLAFYKSDTVDGNAAAEQLADDAQREQVASRIEHYFTVMDGARRRVLPLSIAALLLGAAMVALSARAMSGRPGARSGLVQVTVVQAALAVLTYALTPDVRRAEFEVNAALSYGWLGRYAPPVILAMRSFASALVVVALTRPRSRAFFDAAPGSVSEP